MQLPAGLRGSSPPPTAGNTGRPSIRRSRAHIRSPGEDTGFWPAFRAVADEIAPRGNLVPDTHLVALMRANGVEAIWTRDRDYLKFDGVRVLDPFATA